MTQTQLDEAAVWASAIAGDAEAFASMYDLHRDRVFGHALRLTRSAHDAEDATAMVFLEAWRKRRSVRLVDGSIIGWLLVTTNYVVRNLMRSMNRYAHALAKLPPSPDADDHAEEIGDRLDRTSRESVVREAFGRLNRADQDIITLCVLEEFSGAQAAAALGIPVGTVKSRLSRAKQRLGTLTTASLEAQPIATTTMGGAR
ncbi:RNA polymerase sigma factor [Microbacteriaceae bacterium VKM Ac-2854]|nr:RNA polymerase sigma factor [Microbacteriaceae bacterium VKM Ac-2854]